MTQDNKRLFVSWVLDKQLRYRCCRPTFPYVLFVTNGGKIEIERWANIWQVLAHNNPPFASVRANNVTIMQSFKQGHSCKFIHASSFSLRVERVSKPGAEVHGGPRTREAYLVR